MWTLRIAWMIFFQKQEKFKCLKKGELGSITDADLRTAVMSWMWGKFNEDWTNQYEIIESLSKPCQDVQENKEV